MYREVVGCSGCFRASETKSNAPGGKRSHQAAVHPRRSVPASDVRILRVQDGRSRKGRAGFMARSTSNFHGPQVRASQRASTPRFMGAFRGCTERECTMCGPSCVLDGVNYHQFTTLLVAPPHNTSATSTCLSPRGLTISGCPTFEQLQLSLPHNNAKRRER